MTGHPVFGAPPTPPQRSGWDIALSIALLVLTVVVGVVAGFLGLFLLAFLDHCPPATCSVDGAVNAVFTAVLAAGALGVIGASVTIVQLIRAKPAWPFAVGTLALCVLSLAIGMVAYSAAVS